MGVKNPRACYRELGAELTRVRKEARLSGDQIASKAGWSRTSVWRMETGQVDSPVTDVIHYLVLCGKTQQEMQDILGLARLAERKQGYWLARRTAREAESLKSLIFHESAACLSISYEPQIVPGLLQTAGYARALISRIRGLSLADIEAAVKTRMERQRIIYWRQPAEFTFVINEQALRLLVGGPAVMQEQLLHLVLIGALRQVSLRIVPAAVGERSVFGGSFRLFEYTDYRPLVYLDHLNGGLFVEDRQYVNDYHALLPELTAISLDEEESRSYAAKLADKYDRGSLPDAAHVLAEKHLQRGGGRRLPGDGVEDRRPIYQA